MDITLKLLIYAAIFIAILKYITTNENLIKDNNISQDVEYNLNDYLNDTVKTLGEDQSTASINNQSQGLIFEQIKRINKTNSQILKNQTEITGTSLSKIINDTAFVVLANETSIKDIKAADGLKSGDVSILTCIVEDSNGNGYLGKYTHSKIKNDDIFSIEHEINNSNLIKANFITGTGILEVTNLTGSDISNLKVSVKKLLI